MEIKLKMPMFVLLICPYILGQEKYEGTQSIFDVEHSLTTLILAETIHTTGGEYLITDNKKVDNVIVNGEQFECENKTILTILKNEPAYIKKGCFNFFAKEDSFAIELVNKPYGAYKNLIYPCEGVPENFRVEGLHVLISGNLFKCGKFNTCFSAPNVRLIPTNIFELKTIKIATK